MFARKLFTMGNPKLLLGGAAAAASALTAASHCAKIDLDESTAKVLLAQLKAQLGEPAAIDEKTAAALLAQLTAHKNATPKYSFSNMGGKIVGDVKDTDDFKYFTYEACPTFTPKHKSLMAKELGNYWEKLKDAKTSKGYTLSNAVQTGVETPHLGVGITAGDEESWEVFKDIMYPVIKGWHGYDPATQTHYKDLDPSKLVFSAEQKALFDKYVVSTRIRAARNVSGYSLPSGTDDADREAVKNILVKAFNMFDGELKGTYYPLQGMTKEIGKSLRDSGFLFQVPGRSNLLFMAGAARNWPAGRGIFHNDAKTALCWVNEEDHCRIISMENGGDVKSVFTRFCTISDTLSTVAEAQGTKLMWSDKLGFLGTCPSNLGTGLRASVMIKLPELNKNVDLLEKICDSFDLQPRGSAGEHSAAVGAKWDVSNKQRLGFTEVQLVQKMIDGISKLIKLEEKLASGGKIEPSDYE